MEIGGQASYLVAVVGAGPAGLFAAKQLASEGVSVVLFNRDIKPGGLAEYGIYPDKHKMKEGLRNQFRQVLNSPQVTYFGNITVGTRGDLSLSDLWELGFQAILVTVGAQGTKWLGLPGEDLTGVYHAKDLVYHYNSLPPFSQKPFAIGQRVAVVGVGNVMLDITHYLVSKKQVQQVIAVARRGPGEVKFDKKELEAVAANLDLADLQAEIDRVTPLMRALGQDPGQLMALVQSALPKAAPRVSATCFTLRFLFSPVAILGDAQGRVRGLQVEDNTLVLVDGETRARGVGTHQVLDVDTVIFAIGDGVDLEFGLPCKGSEFVKCLTPRFPIEGISYEVYNPETGRPIDGVFVAGWSRQASAGLVGIARKDGTNGAKAVLQYLRETKTPQPCEAGLCALQERLARLGKPVITQADLVRLEEIEREEAVLRGLEEFKFGTNEDMLQVIVREENRE